MWDHTQNLGPIGSVVLMFIWYKQRTRKTNKVYKLSIESIGEAAENVE